MDISYRQSDWGDFRRESENAITLSFSATELPPARSGGPVDYKIRWHYEASEEMDKAVISIRNSGIPYSPGSEHIEAGHLIRKAFFEMRIPGPLEIDELRERIKTDVLPRFKITGISLVETKPIFQEDTSEGKPIYYLLNATFDIDWKALA